MPTRRCGEACISDGTEEEDGADVDWGSDRLARESVIAATSGLRLTMSGVSTMGDEPQAVCR